MIIDKLDNISKYLSIESSIDKISSLNAENVKSFSSFLSDKNKSTLFVVEDGEALFASSWRELDINSDVLSSIKLEKDNFVLFLPGEPYIVKSDDSKVLMYKLG